MPEVHSLVVCQSIVEHVPLCDLLGVCDDITGDKVVAFAEVGDCDPGSVVALQLIGPEGEELDASPEFLVPIFVRTAQFYYEFVESGFAAGAYRLQLLINGRVGSERDLVLREKP